MFLNLIDIAIRATSLWAIKVRNVEESPYNVLNKQDKISTIPLSTYGELLDLFSSIVCNKSGNFTPDINLSNNAQVFETWLLTNKYKL